MDVRAFGSWMSAPKCLFLVFPGFEGPDRSFGPEYPREWPSDVRRMSVPKNFLFGLTTGPPDPGRVSEGSLKGSLKGSQKGSLKGFWRVLEGVLSWPLPKPFENPSEMLVFPGFEGPDRSFGPGYPREWPRMSAEIRPKNFLFGLLFRSWREPQESLKLLKGGKRPLKPQDFSLTKKTNFVLTKDRKRPYYGHSCGEMHRAGSCSKAAGGP